MRKHLIIITVAFIISTILLSSCGALSFQLRNFKQVKSTYTSSISNNEPINFVVKNNRMLAQATINGEPDTVLLDTGDSQGLTYFHNLSKKTDDYSKLKLQSAHKKSIVYAKMDTVNVQFYYFHNTLKLDICVNYDNPCGNAISDYPVLGNDAIFAFQFTNSKMSLSFTDQKISYYKYNDDTSFNMTGYKPMKCDFSWKQNVLYVYPIIGGVEYKCLFDTGNNKYILLQNKGKKVQKRDGDIILEGAFGVATSGIAEAGEMIVRPDETVTLGDEDFKATVMYIPDIVVGNIGMQFIQRFDWFYDRVKNVLYYKPRDVEENKFNIDQPYKVLATNDGLMIVSRIVDDKNTLRFGDIITSVNGEKITAKNICHYNELLNNTQDWNQFEIEIIH